MELFLHLLSQYGYVAFFFMVLLGGTYVPMIPAGLVVIAVGALSHSHYFQLAPAFLVAVAANVLNNTLVYSVSRWVGDTEWCRKFLVTNRYAARIETEFLKRPYIVVFVSRFFGFLNMPVSILSGVSKFPLVPFVFIATTGDAICIGLYLAAGYVLGLAWAAHIHATVSAVTSLVALGAIVYLVFFFITKRGRGSIEN